MDNILCRQAGERIRQVRKMKGYSRDRLAEQAGISSKFLYEIEQGKKRFSAEALCHIAEVLDVSCDYIMRGNVVSDDDKTGIAEVISLFDINQQRKLVPILKLVNELLTMTTK